MAGRRLSRSGWAAGAGTAGAVMLAALLAACGSSGSYGSGGSGGSGSQGGTGSVTSPAPAGGGARATTVTVRMTEYKLGLSAKTFKAGDYTFVATNDGHTLHSLEIQGQGSDVRLPEGLRPGQSGQVRVVLKDGTYHLFCPVDQHRELGMRTDITVGGAGGTSPVTPSATHSSGGGY
ncbi:copper-binding protein [Streptomyces anandii]|uniref:Copper-binding protein n=1 Tax=Streptomyces anandii TaxID=285454 RepID=A0ABW6HH54_9ACTN